MKRIYAIFLLTLASLGVMAQQHLILPKEPHLNPELRHAYTVLPGGMDKTAADKMSQEIQALIKVENLAIDATADLCNLPDVVFVMDNTPCDAKHCIILYNIRNSQQAFKELKNLYYTSQRPIYSTIFENNVDGYPTFRIPSVVCTAGGALVAAIEARAFDSKDQAENHIAVKTSSDGGRTWGKLIVVASDGKASLNNPLMVYVASKDRILLMYQSYPPNTSEGSVGSSIHTFTQHSDDQGHTWSKPIDITSQVAIPGVKSYCSGPGMGICIEGGSYAGRLVMPFNANGSNRWFNYLVYSDNEGQTWRVAAGRSSYGSNESQVAQIGDTELLVNARSHRFVGDNGYMAPKDWSPWNFERVTRNRVNMRVGMSDSAAIWGRTTVMDNQPDPICQGSIIRLPANKKQKGVVLVASNPASQYTWLVAPKPYAQTPPMRVNGTMKVSHDKGTTWMHAKRIYGDRFTEFQYSCLVNLGMGKVGCMFEANDKVKFAIVDMAWLLSGGSLSK